MDPADHDILIEIKTDLSWIKKKLNDQCDSYKEHEERLSSLETWKDRAAGAITIVEFAVGGGIIFSIISILLWLMGT